MDDKEYQCHNSTSRYSSPFGLSRNIKVQVWQIIWLILCRPTPKILNFWRLFWLRLFGAKINGRPFVHSTARINCPWNLSLKNLSCIGDRATLYALGKITVEERAVIAQEAYICTGTHDFEDENFSLITHDILIEKNSFVGARAFVMPGITIGESAIVGACSVVTKDVDKGKKVAGNPAEVI